jgi:hypothetical protein
VRRQGGVVLSRLRRIVVAHIIRRGIIGLKVTRLTIASLSRPAIGIERHGSDEAVAFVTSCMGLSLVIDVPSSTNSWIVFEADVKESKGD